MRHQEKVFRARQRALLLEHFDANETMFLERELTQLRAKIFEVQYPELQARTFAPKATDIAASAETYSFKVYTPVGKAKFISYKSDDLPRVDVVAKEILGKVRPLGAMFGWDINELREAARMGTALPMVKGKTARDAVERQIDEVLSFGSLKDESGNLPDVGLNGLVNNADVTALGIIAGTYWFGAPLTGAAITAELNRLVAKIGQDSKRVWVADSLLLPIRHFDYIQQTPYSDVVSDSILTVFLENNKQIKTVAPWYVLDDAGAAAKPRAITYKKDPSVLEAVIPQEFEQLPPEARGLELLNPCHARCGGVKIYQPLGMRYSDFATS